jgi:5-methylcytosine-specific restriction endonuclease McrA
METMTEKTVFTGLKSLPDILKLNASGEPLEWIDYEDCATHYAKGNVLWSLGTHEVLLRGGTNSITGTQTRLVMDSIVAINSRRSPTKSRNYTSPPLINSLLFKRDKHLCAYCGHVYGKSFLTRDHIKPRSRGGKNIWNNVVTACKGCNQWKADKLLSELDTKLIYIPYTPTFNEYLILDNRKILQDQMEFLMKGVGRNSRLH